MKIKQLHDFENGSAVEISPVTIPDAVVDPTSQKNLTTILSEKVNAVSGKGLSTNDYTTTEKNKLSGIASGAEVNQNAFSNVKVGSTTISADSKTDTLTLVAGENIELTPDASGDSVTIKAGYPGTMTADEATSGTGTTAKIISPKVLSGYVNEQINSKIAAADAMIYKGTIGTGGTITALPATHSTGWTYKVITAGTYAGVACEVGDMIICLTDGTTSTNSHWTVVQTNIDGAVTGPSKAVSSNVAVFNGTTGKVVKDSGYSIGKSVPSNALFTDTTYTFASGTNGFTVTPKGSSSPQTVTVTPSISTATTSAAGLMSSSDKTKLNGIASGAEVNVQSDWNVTDSSSDAFIKNKPTIPSAVTESTVSGWGFTKNAGTITGVKMNGSSKGTSGVVDLGTVLTSHQTIKQDGVEGATVNRYCACSTAAGTAAKTASVTSGTFKLEAGAKVSVKFSSANTASTPTLNINSTGAKTIFHKGSQITTGGNKSLLAGVVDFIYDGTQWHLIGNYIDTDTKVTSVGNHYTPAENSGSAISASGGSATDVTGTGGKLNVVTGLKRDAAGHVVGVTSANIYSQNTTYSSLSASSGNTSVSLVTRGEKYTWNNKASTAVATTSANGLMSASDKSTVESIANPAVVNAASPFEYFLGATTVNGQTVFQKLSPDDVATVMAGLIGDASGSKSGLISAGDYVKLSAIYKSDVIAFYNRDEYTYRTIPNGIAMFKFTSGQTHTEVFALGDSSVVRLTSSVGGEYVNLTRSGTSTMIACGSSMSFYSKNELYYAYIPLGY